MDLARMSAVDLIAAYKARTLSPVEATAAAFSRIRQANSRVNAFCYLLEEEAMAAAKASEARWAKGRPMGRVDGVPTTIKDLANIKGHPTRKGSLTADASPAAEDSPVTAFLRREGAVFIGKTTTPEFGWAGVTHSPLTGITRNPWDETKTAGGSSGGAGAAAALGMGALHVGSDGGGSIRMPASFCGIFGLKPTTGRIGYHPASAMLSCSVVGPMTRTVADASLMMDVTAYPDPRDWYAMTEPAPSHSDALEAGAKGLRIAYAPAMFGIAPDPEVAKAVEEAARLYKRLGAHVHDAGPMFELPRTAYETFYVANLARLYRTMGEADRARLDPGFRAYCEDGLRVSMESFQEACNAQVAFGGAVQSALASCDLILTPSLRVTAFEAGVEVPAGRGMARWFDWAPWAYPFNFSNHPASSVPCGFDSRGLPTSFQLIGGKGQEALILRASRAFERERPFVMPKV